MLVKSVKINVAIIISALVSIKSHAQQWAAPGDAELRRDIELLKTYDVIDGPVNTWPVSWKQITANINNNASFDLPNYVLSAIDRVSAKVPRKGFSGNATLRYTNSPKLIRGFGDAPRTDADLSVTGSLTNNSFEANVTVSYRDEATNEVVFDGSYGAFHLGNWALYAGAIDRWWGPGQQNTLLLGTNARPMLSAGFRRNEPKAFESKWLNWIGPWTWDMFVAHMGENRAIPDAIMAGMRLSFEPVDKFEVGLSRTMQLCGQNRPCDFNTWTKAIIAVGDLDNTGTQNEPGNQLASIDLSYSFNIGDKSIRLYAEGTAEDEHVIVPFQFSRLIGATIAMPIGGNGDNLSFNVELSDSGNVQAWLFGKRRPGIMYEHRIYRTGHRYDGRVLGHALDRDSKLISLMATFSNNNAEVYSLGLFAASLNWDGLENHFISAQRQTYRGVDFSVSKRFNIGKITATLRHQSNVVTFSQGRLPSVVGELSWMIDI